jgi:[acyl-carrier-protein] S-malonyltransferase
MGEDLFDARPDLLGSTSDEILGWSLREMCLEGPEEELTRTEYAQPALFALSFALWDVLAGALPEPPDGAAGHSLGEYTALCAAGAIGYESALGVVAARGRAMAEAADLEPSGMAALVGSDLDAARSVCAKNNELGGRLEVANINAPGQIVVAGSSDDIAWLSDNARDLGVRRAIPLKVAGAFHSSFMVSAADDVGRALAALPVAEPEFPVWSNTTAEPHDVGAMRRLLEEQVVSTVRFSESLVKMADSGIDTFIHVGPGDVTAGMARRTVPDAEVLVVSGISDVSEVAAALGTMA